MKLRLVAKPLVAVPDDAEAGLMDANLPLADFESLAASTQAVSPSAYSGSTITPEEERTKQEVRRRETKVEAG